MMADGHLNKCKTCVRSRVKRHRLVNEHVREYDRARSQEPQRKMVARRVLVNWRAKHPERYAAHSAVNYALRSGALRKGSCEVCGDERVHGHHDDYSRPLEVRWLCAKHHHRHHAKLKDIGRDPDAAGA